MYNDNIIALAVLYKSVLQSRVAVLERVGAGRELGGDGLWTA